MDKLDLSIIIPCATDVEIERCIQSIYQTCAADVEILVSLNNASEEVRKVLKKFKDVKVCEIEELNLSRAYNNGIEHASRNNILLMDSDCIFDRDTIKLLYGGLTRAKLSKGLVIFRYNNLISKIISKVREYTTTDFLNAFSPPLSFSKDIKGLIGGYYFHEQVPWSEDFEFDYRVQKAGIKIHYNPRAVIYHVPLNIGQDMRSGFRYGKGKRISIALGLLPKRNYLSLSTNAERFIRAYEIFRRKGFLPSLYYLFIWRPVNRIGYIVQGFMHEPNS